MNFFKEFFRPTKKPETSVEGPKTIIDTENTKEKREFEANQAEMYELCQEYMFLTKLIKEDSASLNETNTLDQWGELAELYAAAGGKRNTPAYASRKHPDESSDAYANRMIRLPELQAGFVGAKSRILEAEIAAKMLPELIARKKVLEQKLLPELIQRQYAIKPEFKHSLHTDLTPEELDLQIQNADLMIEDLYHENQIEFRKKLESSKVTNSGTNPQVKVITDETIRRNNFILMKVLRLHNEKIRNEEVLPDFTDSDQTIPQALADDSDALLQNILERSKSEPGTTPSFVDSDPTITGQVESETKRALKKVMGHNHISEKETVTFLTNVMNEHGISEKDAETILTLLDYEAVISELRNKNSKRVPSELATMSRLYADLIEKKTNTDLHTIDAALSTMQGQFLRESAGFKEIGRLRKRIHDTRHKNNELQVSRDRIIQTYAKRNGPDTGSRVPGVLTPDDWSRR